MMGMMVKSGIKIHMGSSGNEIYFTKNFVIISDPAQLCKFYVTKDG